MADGRPIRRRESLGTWRHRAEPRRWSDRPQGNPSLPDVQTDGGPGTGCATWNVEAEVAGLTLHDRPLGYKLPIGPPIDVSLTYSQRDALQPIGMPFTNFGDKWSSNWVSYVEVNGGCGFQVVGEFYSDVGAAVVAIGGGAGEAAAGRLSPEGAAAQLVPLHICDLVHRRGGGSEPFTYPNESAAVTQTSFAGQFSQSNLTRNISGGLVTSIVQQLPDGSRKRSALIPQEIYAASPAFPASFFIRSGGSARQFSQDFLWLVNAYCQSHRRYRAGYDILLQRYLADATIPLPAAASRHHHPHSNLHRLLRLLIISGALRFSVMTPTQGSSQA